MSRHSSVYKGSRTKVPFLRWNVADWVTGISRISGSLAGIGGMAAGNYRLCYESMPVLHNYDIPRRESHFHWALEFLFMAICSNKSHF